MNLAPPSEVYDLQRYTILKAAVIYRSAIEVKMLLRRVPTGHMPRLLNHRAVDGTPLMAACATGRDAAVKSLIARGARTSYVKDGEVYSAFTAAKYHPPVRRWLLVGRFQEGPKLLTCKGVE